MLRIRFHGRGGHGVKTASRILGTAAFLDGWQVQDFPVYGAERRGAAVSAFTRIDHAPILERGVITNPDFVIIGDETLLADATAGVFQGRESVSAIFVNSPSSPEVIRQRISIAGEVQTLDLISLIAKHHGRSSNLSAALGAAACALTAAACVATMEQAVREELAGLSLSAEDIERNAASREVYAQVRPAALGKPADTAPAPLHAPHFEPGPASTPFIRSPGNSAARRTGAWRLTRPVIDLAACTRCLLCLAHCPEGVMSLDAEGNPVVDYDHCKGCMICAQQCPLHCIHEEKEVRAW